MTSRAARAAAKGAQDAAKRAAAEAAGADQPKPDDADLEKAAADLTEASEKLTEATEKLTEGVAVRADATEGTVHVLTDADRERHTVAHGGAGRNATGDRRPAPASGERRSSTSRLETPAGGGKTTPRINTGGRQRQAPKGQGTAPVQDKPKLDVPDTPAGKRLLAAKSTSEKTKAMILHLFQYAMKHKTFTADDAAAALGTTASVVRATFKGYLDRPVPQDFLAEQGRSVAEADGKYHVTPDTK